MDSKPFRPRIYLAGPDVFLPDSTQVFQQLKAQCQRLGMVGLAPTDNDLSADEGGDDVLAQRIYAHNIALIQSADGVIANLQDFRGLEPDAGTVFEVGFAVALRKPVFAYGVPDGSYLQRVAAVRPCTRAADGQMRENASGVMIEGLGQRLNLMLTRSTTVVESAEAALVRLAAHFGVGIV